MEPDTFAKSLVMRRDSLEAARQSYDSFCQTLADYVMPRKNNITSKETAPDSSRYDRLFDTTAIDANIVLANGQLSWTTPSDEEWFAVTPKRKYRNIETVRNWYQDVTEELQERFATSNFYNQIHELYLDRGAFGTGLLGQELEVDPNTGEETLCFKAYQVGSYSIAENHMGMVDTVFRTYRLSVRAAAQKFGPEKLSAKSQEILNDKENPKKADEEIEFFHAVFPRADQARMPGKKDALNKAFCSYDVEVLGQHIVREGGYDEFPYACTRFLQWGSSPYGWSPSWIALPEARQLNIMEEALDTLAEKLAFPSVLAPDYMRGMAGGQPDTGPSALTFFDSNRPDAKPVEWAMGGRYDVGVDRANHRRKRIESAFFVDMFKMFANMEGSKEMTAREVMERSSERLTQYSPTFSRMQSELLNPLILRSFGIGIRAGWFDAPPQEAVARRPLGGAFLPSPGVMYNSRIALAIRQLQNISYQRNLDTIIIPLAQIDPSILHNYNLDVMARDSSANAGLPSRWMRKQEEVDKIRQDIQQAAEEERQVALAQQGADAAQKVSTIPPERLAAMARN